MQQICKDDANGTLHPAFAATAATRTLKRKKEAKAIHSVDGGTVQYIGCAYDNWQVTAPDGKIWKAVSDSILIDRNSSAEVVTSCLS